MLQRQPQATSKRLYYYTALISSTLLHRLDKPTQAYPRSPITITYRHIPLRPVGEMLQALHLALPEERIDDKVWAEEGTKQK